MIKFKIYLTINLNIYISFLVVREGDDAKKALPNAPSLKDEIKRLPVVQLSGKVKGLDLILDKGNELRVGIIY